MGRTSGNFSGGRSAGSRSSSGGSSRGGSRAGFSSGRSRGFGGSSRSGGGSSFGGGGFGSTRGSSHPSRSSMPRGGGGPAPVAPPPPRRSYFGWGRRFGRGYGYGGGGYAPGGGCGCLSSVVSLFVMLAFVLVMFLAFIPTACTSTYSGTNQLVQTQTTTHASTKARTKLSSADCTPIDEWYQDLAEWIDDPSAVTQGMKQFYNKTGVQPYLIVSTNIEGKKDYSMSEVETYLRNRYDELFGNDAGHLILLFCEPYDGEYDPYLIVGEKAQLVIDTEAENIIYATIDECYPDSSLTNSEYFGKIFSQSANDIMAGGALVETSSTPATTASRTVNPIIMGVAALACGAAIAYFVLPIIRKKTSE